MTDYLALSAALAGPFAALATRRQFLLYKLVPGAAGRTEKIPLDASGETCNAHDAACWLDAQTALAAARARGFGVAFVFTVDDPFAFVDIDGCLQADGKWSPLAIEICTMFAGAAIEVSSSGKGLHIFCSGACPPHKKKNSAHHLELYTELRFVALTGTGVIGNASTDCSAALAALTASHFAPNVATGPALPVEWIDAPVPGYEGPADDAELIALALDDRPKPRAMFGGGATFADLWHASEAKLASAYPGESERDMALASHLAYFTGNNRPRIRRLMLQSALARDKWTEHKTYLQLTIDEACKGKTQFYKPPVGRLDGVDKVKLDDFVAYLPAHTYAHLPTRDLWPASSVDGHVLVWPRTGEGKPIKPSTWLDRNQFVQQMTWAPGRPQIIRDEVVHMGGFAPLAGNSILNLYLPPRDMQGDARDVAPWLEHLRAIYPDDAAHLALWFAHRVQRPHEKINHALVLGGAPGIGKDSIFEPLKRGVGPHNTQEISPTQMLGRFTAWAKCVLLRVSELRDLGEVNRFAFYEHCKSFLASPPDVLRVDEKNLREYYVANVLGVVFTTNNRTDGLYLPADDRRHYVAWSDATRERFDAGYWQRLWGWYERGGAANVVAYLRGLDLAAFDAKAPPPKTDAFWSIVQAGEAPESSELRDAIESMGVEAEAFTLGDVAGAALSCGLIGLAAELRDRRQHRSIPHKLDRVGYQSVRNPGSADGRWKVNGSNQTIYARAGVSVRDQIRAAQQRAAKAAKAVISHPHP